MNDTTRRSFLACLGGFFSTTGLLGWILPSSNLAAQGPGDATKASKIGQPNGPQDPFPFLEFYEPFPQGQPLFEGGIVQPSFLHPNGAWACLAGLCWDWRTGVPVKRIGESIGGDRLPEPCSYDGTLLGCFSADGGAWICAAESKDEPRTLIGIPTDGGEEWRLPVSRAMQVDPKRPIIHVAGQVRNDPEDKDDRGVFAVDAKTGKTTHVLDLPTPLKIGHFDSGYTIALDGRWLLGHHFNNKPSRNPMFWWAIWSLADGRCRAYRVDDSAKPGVSKQGWPAFSLDGATAFLAPDRAWNWSGIQSDSELATDPTSHQEFGPSVVRVDQGKIELTRKGEGILEVRASEDQTLIRRIVAFPPNNSLIAFSPKAHLLLAAPPSGTPWLWNRQAPMRPIPASIGDGPLQRPGFSPLDYGSARSLAWSTDGRRVAVGSDEGPIGIFRPAGFRIPTGSPSDEKSLGRPVRILSGLDEAVRGLAFLPEGVIGLAQDGQVAIWGSKGEKPVQSWRAHPHRANSIQLQPGSNMVATGGLDGASLWNIADGSCLQRFGSPHSGVSCLHFDPTGRRLAVTYLDGWLTVFDVKTGKALWEKQEHQDVAAAVAFHPSGSWLVSLGWDSQLYRWNAATGKAESAREAPKASGCLAWSRDGKWLAIGGSNPQILDSSLELVDANLDFLWDVECT
jgi:WD40 repeat protein